MGWGSAISRIAGLIDGWFAISPEERVKRLKNKIDRLKRQRDDILKKGCNQSNAAIITRINNDLRLLEDRIKNEAR